MTHLPDFLTDPITAEERDKIIQRLQRDPLNTETVLEKKGDVYGLWVKRSNGAVLLHHFPYIENQLRHDIHRQGFDEWNSPFTP